MTSKSVCFQALSMFLDKRGHDVLQKNLFRNFCLHLALKFCRPARSWFTHCSTQQYIIVQKQIIVHFQQIVVQLMVGPCSFDQTSTIQPLIAMMLNQSYWHYRLVSRQEKDTQIHPNPIFLSFSGFIASILGGWPTRKVNNQLDLCKSLNSSNGWNEYITIQNF